MRITLFFTGYGIPTLVYIIDMRAQGKVRDDPKFPDDSGGYLNPNGGVGGLIPDCEIFSLLNGKTKSPPTAR